MVRAGAALTSVLVGLAIAALSGCGSVRNLASDDPRVYGGVARDPLFESGPPTEGAMCLAGVHGEGKEGMVVAACVLLFIPAIIVADVTTNLAADTLTLPLAFYLNRKALARDKEPVPNQPPTPTQAEKPLILPTCLLQNGKAERTAESDATAWSEPRTLERPFWTQMNTIELNASPRNPAEFPIFPDHWPFAWPPTQLKPDEMLAR